ncbi:MAG: PaREP1 family protein [bacterium]|nr:PaREP1 family protein [bacterium]
MTTLTYQDAARHLLAQGIEELTEGDSRQASEKGWGAAAQMIKAVASSRGWKHDSHASLYRVIDRLVKETGDDGIRSRFGVANGLHQNFYENWAGADYVAGGLADVRGLLDRLEPLLNHQGSDPAPTT